MILSGDVGGTKTILALYKQSADEWVCHKKEIYSSAAFAKFSTLLEAFLDESEGEQLQSVCIGVAGPIVEGDCVATNLPWELKRKEMSVQLGLDEERVCLLNDLEATAWGVMALPEKDFVELNPDARKAEGNLAILAAGTGLGEALAIWGDNKYHVVATEGGHTDFAPRNELEIGLLRYLLNKYEGHVSYERVVSGLGLVNIYQYLGSIGYSSENGQPLIEMKNEDPAAVIGRTGVLGKDLLCAKALAMFCEIYGAEAGNLSLKCLPKAGVVLAGGIAGKVLPAMQRGDFMRGYLAKGRYDAVLRRISVRVCTNTDAALIGAKNHAIAVKLQRKVG